MCFCKQKMAYEMRISEWSSDVCSSDLKALAAFWNFGGCDEMKRANVTLRDGAVYQTYMGYVPFVPDVQIAWAKLMNAFWGSFIFASIGAGVFAWWFIPWAREQIGRASCRERVCQYV